MTAYKVCLLEPGGDRIVELDHLGPKLYVAWFDNDRNYMGDLVYHQTAHFFMHDGARLPMYRFVSIRPNAAYTRFVGLEQ